MDSKTIAKHPLQIYSCDIKHYFEQSSDSTFVTALPNFIDSNLHTLWSC